MRDKEKQHRVTPIYLTWLEYLREKHGFATKVALGEHINELCGTTYTRQKFSNFESGIIKVPSTVLEKVYQDLPELLKYLNYQKMDRYELAYALSVYDTDWNE